MILFESLNPKDLLSTLEENNAKNVLIVTGKKSFIATGASKFIEDSFASKFNIFKFDNFSVNPKFEDVLSGVTSFKINNCDFIIAIGGGSVIDMAKCINAFQAQGDEDFTKIVLQNKISKKGVPLFAIPTTSGSGSEATKFAVIYYDNKKYSIDNDSLLPNYVGLNYSFTLSLSPYNTACSGLDALAQSIESYWSVNSTQESKLISTEAIKLILSNLEEAVISPSNKNREALMKGAFLAGKAINITKTTGPHALSYVFTTFYGIPHGHAVFLSLPQFFNFNSNINESDLNDIRGIEYVQKMMKSLISIIGCDSPDSAKSFLINYANRIGVNLSLQELQVNDYEKLLNEYVGLERLKNNPRAVNSSEFSSLFIS